MFTNRIEFKTLAPQFLKRFAASLSLRLQYPKITDVLKFEPSCWLYIIQYLVRPDSGDQITFLKLVCCVYLPAKRCNKVEFMGGI